MKIYDRIMGLGTKMTDMDASTYQGAFIGKISYTVDREKAEAADSITYEYGDVKENAFMYILSILGKVEGEETPVEKMTITLVKASDKEKEIKRVEKTDYEDEKPFHTFTKEEVYTGSPMCPQAAPSGHRNMISHTCCRLPLCRTPTLRLHQYIFSPRQMT